MDPSSWKELQIWVSAIIAVAGISYRWIQFAAIKKKDPDTGIDFLNFIIYKPMALSMLFYISTVVTEMKYVNFNEQLSKRADVSELSSKLNIVYKQFDNPHDKIITSIINDKVAKFNKFLTYATNNEKVMNIDKNSNEFSESADKIFKNCDDGSRIYATSYVNHDRWWKEVEGQDYLKTNYDFIKDKSGSITRIHLFKDTADSHFFWSIMGQEKAHKIKVYYIFTKDIPDDYYNLKEDIIVVSNQLAGKLTLDDKRNPLSVAYYGSEEKIQEFQATFDKLKRLPGMKEF
ncbi:hypothetical protein [Mucilaginibacter sp. OK098]|uniref:hypothetical protein n=1 Tax=Mucilaginibacter sp. OK098 TaxID=1855297 RepID=UPI000917DB8D|nr:hypothetical protein [Mucilaginibacter sp. OK098]SHL96165.1 hypothetical protein SAMN05216524_101331 [Mucilaginibacter sp. OK098]